MNEFDVIIIGSGAGGLSAGSLLADTGDFRVLVLEKLPFIGGRFSSLVHNGFTLSTGAVSIEAKGPLEKIFNTLGLPFNIRCPEPQVKYMIDGRQVALPPKNALEFLLNEACRSPLEVNSVLRALKDMPDSLPRDVSIASWLSQHTDDPGASGVFHALCGGIFSVSLQDAPMAEFLNMIRFRSFRKYGFPVGGNAELAKALGGHIEEHGGMILKGAKVTDIVVKDGLARCVKWIKDGKEQESECAFVISNIGAGNTQRLAGSAWFSSEERAAADQMKPSYTLTIEVFSDRPFVDFDGILMLPQARRAAFIACPSLICPEWAPKGQHLTIVLGPPSKSEEPFNSRGEFKLLLDDAKEYLPGFDRHSTGWLTRSFRKDWPGFRARPGFDLPRETSIPNLFNVGDSVKPPGLYGVGACADSALCVAEKILQSTNRQHPW